MLKRHYSCYGVKGIIRALELLCDGVKRWRAWSRLSKGDISSNAVVRDLKSMAQTQ